MPLLQGQEMLRQKPLQWHHYNTNIKNKINPNAVMRQGDYVICGFYAMETQFGRASWREKHLNQVQNGKLVRFTLYNLKDDPQQKNNLAVEEQELFTRLKTKLQQAHSQMQKEAIGWKGVKPVQSFK